MQRNEVSVEKMSSVERAYLYKIVESTNGYQCNFVCSKKTAFLALHLHKQYLQTHTHTHTPF